MTEYVKKEVTGMGGSKMKLSIPEKFEIEVSGDDMYKVEEKFDKLYELYRKVR